MKIETSCGDRLEIARLGVIGLGHTDRCFCFGLFQLGNRLFLYLFLNFLRSYYLSFLLLLFLLGLLLFLFPRVLDLLFVDQYSFLLFQSPSNERNLFIDSILIRNGQ